MAKKNKQNIDDNGTILIDPPKSVGTNKDNYQRLNYLYQLSTWSTLSTPTSIKEPLSRMYIRNFDLIGKKVKCNISPDLKRTICKKCNRLLIINKSCNVTIENKSGKKKPINDDLVIVCKCGHRKVFRFGLNRGYKSFHDQNLIKMNKK